MAETRIAEAATSSTSARGRYLLRPAWVITEGRVPAARADPTNRRPKATA